ncbi:hypothetical protein C8R44DRAFT_141384 [Mycena epipterygia]|nr:hypothetical protein C8R44DRAFT_141384 [Mycena epipterygia]
MKRTSVYTLEPSAACPFHVQAVQYVPEQSYTRGLTLIFLHATNTHKETFEPVVRHLLRQPFGTQIRDVWCIGMSSSQPDSAPGRRVNREPKSWIKCRQKPLTA